MVPFVVTSVILWLAVMAKAVEILMETGTSIGHKNEKLIPIQDHQEVYRRHHVPYYTVVNVENLVRSFNKKLRRVILLETFEVNNLESQLAQLNTEFSPIESLAENLNHFKDITAQLSMAKIILLAMNNSIPDVLYCKNSIFGSNLVCFVIGLRLKAVALVDLCNVHGCRNYGQHFMRLWRSISYVEDRFKTLVGVSRELREVFQNYLTEAKRLLDKMGASVPGYA